MEPSAEESIKSLIKELWVLAPTGFYKGAAKLEWTPFKSAQFYQVKITRTDKQTYRKFIVKRSSFHIMVFWGKPYVWQIRPLDAEKKPLSNYSKPFPIRVIYTDAEEPSDKSEIQVAEESEEVPELSKTVVEENQAINDEPLDVSEKESSKPIEVDEFPFLIKDIWFWLGTGYNFVSYDQKVDGFSNLTYQSFKGPTIYASGGTFLTDHFGFEASFKDTIGQIDNSENGQAKMNYHWRIITLEGLYRQRKSLNEEGYIKGGQWFFRAGLQHHTMPFLNVPSFSSLLVDFRENTLITAHAGASYYFSPSPRLRYELMLRYQHPISASGDQSLSVSPIFAFDGSVGFSYKMTDDFHLGAHWYGQWHSFKYEYGSGSGLQSGEQNLIFSNFDVRVGVEY